MMTNLLENIYVKKDFQLNDVFSIHPSGILNCSYAQALNGAGIAPYTTVEQELLFCVANGGHAFIELMLGLESGLNCECEKTIRMPEYLLSGTPDIIASGQAIEDLYNRDRILIEIKTTAFVSSSFEPRPSYIAQANMYMAMTGIDICEILTISRVNGAYNVYTLGYDAEFTKTLFDDIDNIYDYLERGEMPPQTGNCEKCWYMKYCFSNSIDRIEDYVIRLFNDTIADNVEYQKRRCHE